MQQEPSVYTVLLAGQGPTVIAALKWLGSQPASRLRLVAFYPWQVLQQAKVQGWRFTSWGFVALEEAGLRNALAPLLKRKTVTLLKHPKGLNHLPLLRHLTEELGINTILTSSWGEKISLEALQATEGRCEWFNLHPSLLPAHRGPNPYISVLRTGESQTGVSVHRINERWDDGEVLAQQAVPVQPYDTGGSLRERCVSVIPAVLEAAFTRLEQPEAKGGASTAPAATTLAALGVSYYKGAWVNQCFIEWSAPPEVLERWHRAVQPWFQLLTHTQEGVWLRVHTLHVERLQAFAGGGVSAWVCKPGCILAVTAEGHVWVASSVPGVAVVITAYQVGLSVTLGGVFGWEGWWPKGLSRKRAVHELHPGQLFL